MLITCFLVGVPGNLAANQTKFFHQVASAIAAYRDILPCRHLRDAAHTCRTLAFEKELSNLALRGARKPF